MKVLKGEGVDFLTYKYLASLEDFLYQKQSLMVAEFVSQFIKSVFYQLIDPDLSQNLSILIINRRYNKKF